MGLEALEGMVIHRTWCLCHSDIPNTFFYRKTQNKTNTNVSIIKESSEPTRRPQNRQLKTTLTKGNCGVPDWTLDHKKERSKKKTTGEI